MVPGFLAPTLLSAAHNVDDFICGKDQLDVFLKRYALKNQKRDSSRTYVACPEPHPNRVVGYYSLAFSSVLYEKVPANVQQGMPKYDVPVMLLGKLAVDRDYRPPNQTLRLGEALLKDALIKTTQAAAIAGLKAVLVDAIDEETVGFYKRFGFQPSPIEDLQLFLPVDSIRASLDAAAST